MNLNLTADAYGCLILVGTFHMDSDMFLIICNLPKIRGISIFYIQNSYWV